MAGIAGTTIRDDTGDRHRRKYENRNPLQRLALGRFHDEAAETIRALAPRSVLDFGCGEGFLAEKLIERGVALDGYVGVDLRAEALADARRRLPGLRFVEADILVWPETSARFDLVLASQVLEHLPNPEQFLARLCEACSGRLILTVPHEPWFQLLNLARGRDLPRLGNHPEHINRWTSEAFADFVAAGAVVERVWPVFPFTFVLARPR
ncbi:MAG: class I SAM-dependent methyltransferase [Parvularculaceae bacterium]